MEDDLYFLTLMRYVKANPLKAKLVARAQDWEGSSLRMQRWLLRNA